MELLSDFLAEGGGSYDFDVVAPAHEGAGEVGSDAEVKAEQVAAVGLLYRVGLAAVQGQGGEVVADLGVGEEGDVLRRVLLTDEDTEGVVEIGERIDGGGLGVGVLRQLDVVHAVEGEDLSGEAVGVLFLVGEEIPAVLIDPEAVGMKDGVISFAAEGGIVNPDLDTPLDGIGQAEQQSVAGGHAAWGDGFAELAVAGAEEELKDALHGGGEEGVVDYLPPVAEPVAVAFAAPYLQTEGFEDLLVTDEGLARQGALGSSFVAELLPSGDDLVAGDAVGRVGEEGLHDVGITQ